MTQAARAGDWKAVRDKEGGPVELYDLAKDPGEKEDVAVREVEVLARMEKILEEAHRQPRAHAGGTSSWVGKRGWIGRGIVLSE